jgi:beta-lactamase class A
MSAKDTDKKNITIAVFLIVLPCRSFVRGIHRQRNGDAQWHSKQQRRTFTIPAANSEFIRPVRGLRPPDSAHRELKPFRYKVVALIQGNLSAGEASTVSVFFRDLKSGHWFGIREQEAFSPESLLKLPLMVAYFKWAESDPRVLRRKILYAGSEDEIGLQRTRASKPFEKGRSYTVDDLILRMIAYDDADARALLMTNLPPGYLDRVFKDIYPTMTRQRRTTP